MSKPRPTRLENVTRVFKIRWKELTKIKKHFVIQKHNKFKVLATRIGMNEAIILRERRLDTSLWKSGLCEDIFAAKSIIRQGLVTVNMEFAGNLPSRQLQSGDICQVHETSFFPPEEKDPDEEVEEDKEDMPEEVDEDGYKRHSSKVTTVDKLEPAAIIERLKANFLPMSEHDRVQRIPPFHLDVHYPSKTFVFSEKPVPDRIEYPFRVY